MPSGLQTLLTCLQIFGATAINVPDLLQSLRKEGDVVTIGTETGVLESKRCAIEGVIMFCTSQSAFAECI